MSRMLPYRVEIYWPTNENDRIISFESQNPFMTISVGDTLDPSGWGEGAPKTMLRVKRIEHHLCGGFDDPHHVLRVYTEAGPEHTSR